MQASASLSSPRPGSHIQTGSYTLRKLLSDVPLSADGNTHDVRITCVEFWNENLYIGTSAAEILHFVLIPPEPNDPLGQPSFIIASRLQPAFTQQSSAGVQQILLLPNVNKACILCNNALTFYTLPELSPAFATQKPISCVWIGGIDQNGSLENDSEQGVMIMMCLRSRIQLVRIGEEPRRIRNIEFGGCLSTSRRDDFACVADTHSYALLDVVHQQKIPLFPISSLDEEAAATVGGASQDISMHEPSPSVSRSVSSSSNIPRPSGDERGHGRSTSWNTQGTGERFASPKPRPLSGIVSGRYGFDAPEVLGRSFSPSPARTPEGGHAREGSPAPRTATPDKALPPTPAEAEAAAARRPSPPVDKKKFTPLKPHIVSPTPSEFLLTTGTTPDEPGVGMFVNLDGDVVRGTLEFESYPEAVVIDGSGIEVDLATSLAASLSSSEPPEEGYILAVIKRKTEHGVVRGVEIQRWDVDPGEGIASKEWLNLSMLSSSLGEDVHHTRYSSQSLGIRTVVSETEVNLSEISDILSLRRLHLTARRRGGSISVSASEKIDLDKKVEADKERDEVAFTSRLCKFKSRNVLWNHDEVWWVVRNPLIVQLDAKLRLAQSSNPGDTQIEPNTDAVRHLLNSIRGLEPRNEAEFLGFTYIRQKASLLLFMDLILRTESSFIAYEIDKRTTEEALLEGEIDPRIILALLPILNGEVIQGEKGIWVQGGLKDIIEKFLAQRKASDFPTDPAGPFGDNLLQLTKRYLLVWRRKKGFGSVADEDEVFQTVDAALLKILLLLDTQSQPGPATPASLRAELNALVDNGVDCWDRAIELLEEHQRLYVLSRLYQSRKQANNVLATWRRIIDGEPNQGGDFLDAEQEFRKYLSRIRDQAMVEEYGTWLANRNPRLGVQVFADEHSRVKFRHDEAVALLREKAPAAVKEYLEYLVYGKKQTQYANDLIAYYLDIVVAELEQSNDSKSTLLQTYETYRALRPPKPTYRQFITENALEAEWWHSRLRLLQLLGTGQDAASSYDVSAILTRLAPYEQELVPEMIILNGRQGRHEEAIRLLTHGLGDFDTAISYCLLGGSSIYRPPGARGIPAEDLPSHAEQARLFGYLLHEFLRVEDITERVERTAELLERFGGWFDVAQVLQMIPDDWSLEIFSGFIISALRRLVRERNETGIARALSGASNLRASAEVVEKLEGLGVKVDREGGGGDGRDEILG
ncbi:Citron-like protein [Macrophomina phaseolina MS6]|uniref:Citron-like protein n=1 Tax=Macrophomina phaseolina (strain MS6) TaxID=1126212 RepID=K2RDA3_MACPH|nr:Citron-like protein [Macrophomina phaseolina MS6]